MEEEKEFLELIEETRKGFSEKREKFIELFPSLFRDLLKWSAENFPEEKFKELLQETRVHIAEGREKITQIWGENLDRLFSLIKKQFEEPIKPEEIEEKALALIDLLKEAAHLIIEELKAIDMMEAELDKVTKK